MKIEKGLFAGILGFAAMMEAQNTINLPIDISPNVYQKTELNKKQKALRCKNKIGRKTRKLNFKNN